MVVDFNKDWGFYREGFQKRLVNIPHDAMIEEERHPDNPSGSAGAFFAGGNYVYEKEFEVPVEWSKKKIHFEFEGVYRKAEVFLNGKKAGGCSYGYSSFWIETEGLLKYGEMNLIRVEVKNSEQPNSRWYTGSGIYRPVWMWVQNSPHILPEGVRITTLSYDPAQILVETEHTGGEVVVEILDGDKRIVSGIGEKVVLEIPDARLWSDESPVQYTCHVILKNEDEIQDEQSVRFGIRKLEWSTKGFFVNGKETLLRGGCVHHDNGILGARCYEISERRKIRILKEAGYNAIRSSHNPASKAMLKACDDYGMYVIDETWDMWYNHKNKDDYASDFREHYKEDILAMVKRDYNHPSVIFYSIGNEVSEPAKEEGIALEKEMVEYLHELDSTRAVTCGFNLMIVSMAASGTGIYKEEGGREEKKDTTGQAINSSAMFNAMASRIGEGMNLAGCTKEADEATTPGLDLLDIAGYNYASGRYPMEGEAHPDRIIYGSETFPQDIGKNWAMVKHFPYLIGDFMWTAWDYLGETGIGAWAYTEDGARFDKPYPWILGDVGAFDILGNENAEAGYAQVVWGIRRQPYIGVQPVNHPGIEPSKAVWRGTNAIPSWSWKGCEGNQAVVEVYADAGLVRLFLNGECVGEQKPEEMKSVFEVEYRPGILEAVAYTEGGLELGGTKLESASERIGIRIEPEETEVKLGDIVYVPVVLADENGRVECNADTCLVVKAAGGELLAFGSANPRTEERYDAGRFTTYYGRALAVVRCTRKGRVVVEVEEAEKNQAADELTGSPLKQVKAVAGRMHAVAEILVR